jgi:nicotinate phosphoribosyltransferase
MEKTVEAGFYSATYFNKLSKILEGREVPVTMQVFQRGHGVLYGMDEAVSILRGSSKNGNGKYLSIHALPDGSVIEPWETVMTIEGNLADFAHLESVYLGVLARGTRVATNMRRVVDAAAGKPILFMGDRFDRYENQYSDGEAALIGGASAICTEAMGYRNFAEPAGTVPHALIAAFGGDIVEALRAYRATFPDQPLTALVDFNNDCVGDSLRCLKEFGKDLHAVRLDTSGNMVDVSLQPFVDDVDFSLKGVNEHLVKKVRGELDLAGGRHVNIVVSGGFTPEKIRHFEENWVPVDMYGVGSSVLKTGEDFTADIVKPVAKQGREFRPNPRLVEV